MSFYGALPRVGFLVPDTRFTAANEVAADAVGDESAPKAGGIAEADSTSTRMVIETTGDQDTDLVYQIEQGGSPQIGGGARYSYRTSSEASTARRGWNAPNLITGWTAADYSTTANTMACALGLANGQVLVAYRAGSTTAYFQTYTPDADAWSGTIAFPTTVHATGGIAMAQLPEGNVVVMFRESGGEWRIYRYSIADAVSGGSWVLHASNMMGAPGTAATRTRLIITPQGDWCFFYGYSNVLLQYASNNHGGSFTLVLTAAPDASTLCDACLAPSGKIVVVATVSTDVLSYTIGSPWTPYTSVTSVTVTTSNTNESWLASDPVGRVYLYLRDVAAADAITMYYTDDDGAAWEGTALYSNGDASSYITAGQVVPAGGALWMCHQFVDSSSTFGGSVCLAKLGGWSSVTVGGTSLPDDKYRYYAGGAYGKTLIPIALPSSMTGWTGSGSGTWSLVGNHIRGATSTNQLYVNLTTAPSDTEAQLSFISCRQPVGGSGTLLRGGFTTRVSTGGNDYEVGLFVSTTAVVVYDVVAGAALATLTTDMMTLDMDFVVYVAPNSHVFVAYKRPYNSTWTELYEGGASSGTGSTGRFVRVGSSSTNTDTFEIRHFLTISMATASPKWGASTESTYNSLIGRLLTSLPAAIDKRSAYGRKQAYVRGKDGPGRVTDTFQARTRADFPREAVMWQHAPSPRQSYKTSEATTGMTMAWQPGVAVNSSYGSPMLAMAVLNTNAPTHTLHGDPNDGGGYDLLGTLDLTVGFAALTFTRSGTTIRINGGTKGSRYVMAGEFVGASWYDGTVARRIERHTEGVWDTEGRMVEIVLATDGEGAYDGTEAASGTCWIYAHSGVLVIPGAAALNYKKLKWTAPGGSVVTDTKYRTGKVLIGGVQVMGQPWDWGYTAEYSVPVTETETRPGVVRRSALGPDGRVWGVSWSEGVDQSHLRGASTTVVPDYLGLGAGMAGDVREATRGDVPFLLAGLLAHTRGGEVPVVVLPKLPTAATSITDPTLFLYGRMQPEIRLESVQGDEGSNEVYRVPTVQIRGIT